MACIIKIPTQQTKGVVTFTTQERDKFILDNENLQQRIEKLKDKWVFGLHHNWHDFKFKYNPVFDFSMAGEADLIEVNNNKIPLLQLDACNFSPDVFHFSQNEKFWDILYVARAVNFKKIPEFFQIIRELYDMGLRYRVLLVSPIPSDCKQSKHEPSHFCNIREVYNKMFSQSEQHLFTLLTTNYNNEFPFDIATISQFYKLSRVFVHAADEERRPRVGGYAWACGMPVVAMDAVVSLLPKELQKKPYAYIPKNYSEFPLLIKEAVEFTKSLEYSEEVMLPSAKEVSEIYTKNILLKELSKYGADVGDDTLYALSNLDIRLGRHHGLGDNTNSVGWSMDSLLNYLENVSNEQIALDITNIDPERYITKYTSYGKVEKESQFKYKIKFTPRGILIHLYNKYIFLQKLRKFLQGK